MRIQRINGYGMATKQLSTSYPMFNSRQIALNDSVSFGNTVLKPNQVLPKTELLIQKGIRQIKVEKKKIIKALTNVWNYYAMGKKSNIYIGHGEPPLDENQVGWLQHRIQLTGKLPGNRKVFFYEAEPNKFSVTVSPAKNTHNLSDVMYDIDYRADKDGLIEEFNPDYNEPSSDPVKIKELNERLQYCLNALFPKKKAK